MRCTTTKYFGAQEYTDNVVIRMPAGLPGFESEREFLLIQFPEQHPLVYLQSVVTEDLCFGALPVRVVDQGYLMELSDEDASLLQLNAHPRIGDEVLCLALLAGDEGDVAANLLAPVVVNIKTGVAAQCFNAAGDYSHRQSLGKAVAA